MLEDEREVAIPMDRVIAYELELRGVHGMAVGRYDALLRLVESGAVDPGRLIGRTIGLDDAGAELAAMGSFAQRGVTVIPSCGAGPARRGRRSRATCRSSTRPCRPSATRARDPPGTAGCSRTP